MNKVKLSVLLPLIATTGLAWLAGGITPAHASLYWFRNVHANPITVCFVGDAVTSRPDRVQQVQDYMQEFEDVANIVFDYLGACPAPTTRPDGTNAYAGDIRIILPNINISGTGAVPGVGCALYNQTDPGGYNGGNDTWGSWSLGPSNLEPFRSCLYNLKLGDDGNAAWGSSANIPYKDHTLHEVGHGLGLNHGHERLDASCFHSDPAKDLRSVGDGYLTPFDINSVMNYVLRPPDFNCDTDGNYSRTGLSKWDELGLQILYPENTLPAEFVGETLLHKGDTLNLQSAWKARGANMSFVASNFLWKLNGAIVSSTPELVMPMNTTGNFLVEFSFDDFLGRSYASSITVRVTGPLKIVQDFNVFILGNSTHRYTDVEGRLAVGGNASFSGYSVGNRMGNSGGTRDDVIVGGTLSYSNGTVANGNVVSGGPATLSSLNIPNGSYRQDNVVDFATQEAYLQGLSRYWADLAPNGSTNVQYYGSTAQITLTGTDPQLNIFTLSGSDVAAAHAFIINAPGGSTVLVNISGTNDRMQYFGFSLNGPNRRHVLYNFYEANNLRLGGISVEGTVLAPFAAIAFPHGNINGTLIGASLSGSGEAHHHPFAGDIAAPKTVLDIVEVSSPAINCIFDTDCTVTVTDTADVLLLNGMSGNGTLQSRTLPIGEAGTIGAGLYAYLYRIELVNQASTTDIACATSLSLDVGPITPLNYDGVGGVEDIYVVTSGGLGNTAPTRVTKAGDKITFTFDPLICTGNKAPNGDHSFFFGFASAFPAQNVQAEVTDRDGMTYTLNARAPNKP